MNNKQAEMPESVEDQLEFIQSANNLRSVNRLLTQVMAKQRIQALIKEENLSTISDAVMDLALAGDGDDDENRLLAAAVLGRLSAVARTRDAVVFERISELFESTPLPIETLADGDEKYYASLSFAAIEADWLVDYCHQQSVLIDTSEKARRVLLSIALREAGSLSDFWQMNQPALSQLSELKGGDTRYKRIRRITSASSEIVREWQGEVGVDAGLALANWFSDIVKSSKKDVGEEVLTGILDESLTMLIRIIELRFSNALLSPTYGMLGSARDAFGRQGWTDLLRSSNNIDKVRIALKEAALVLARQDKQDPALMGVLVTAYDSRERVMPAITLHFTDAQDLIPETKLWWEQAGELKKSQRVVEQVMGNPEDQQIGSLLINVEESKTVMEKLERAVVPFLEISDPPLAETVKKAAGSYSEIAIAARQLATMRKLKHMNEKGKIVEYKPLKYEMLGGHKLGIRKVKVERDGIQKEFGGKIKVLVKPRVSPVE
ncbi:hypothetical protein DWB85_12455 [Seongchinamella sediminis]|uniref:Uncharacterized protein n=1 Tax=Seongchinamella sediminis TaxID=2283635 RepID=A0A3L7DYD9_9GAMM|nr:hypothetical protein [Seongchinamella sediminis]RLQ21560.1 hypothetical protein DWB85_12455 [Seongchinamella sediminis]